MMRFLFPKTGRTRSLTLLAAIWFAVTASAGNWADPLVLQTKEYTGTMLGVETPRAEAAVVNDTMGSLIVGHRPDENGHHLSVFVLDDEGRPADDPRRARLPSAAGTEHVAVHPLSLVIHPELPLLYVFCDAVPPADNVEETLALTYRLHVFLMHPGTGGLTLLRSAGAGNSFDWERNVGLAAIDRGGRHLFLPHLRDSGNAVGYVPLDRRGMFRTNEDDAIELITEPVTPLGRGFLGGSGYVAGGEDAVVFAGPNGPATWDLLNRRARFTYFPLVNSPGNLMLGGRPDDPSFYMVGQNSGFLARMIQAGGYISLLPQVVTIDPRRGASLEGPPLVMAGARQLAVADADGVYVFDLENDGRFAGTVRFTRLQTGDRRVIAWSERFQQLYTVNP